MMNQTQEEEEEEERPEQRIFTDKTSRFSIRT